MRSAEQNARVWEIDALRGFLILSVLIAHLILGVYEYCINGYYHIDPYAYIAATDPLRCWFYWDADGTIYLRGWVTFLLDHCVGPADLTFFIIAGIACQFSRNGMKAFFRLFVAGAFLTLYTYLLYVWTGIPNLFMRFSFLLSLALCHLIYDALFKNRSTLFTLAFSAVFIFAGYYLFVHPIMSNSALLHPFGIRQARDAGEYLPLCPYFGWFLIGIEIGKKWYKQRITLFPRSIFNSITRPLQWMGQYSGIIYVLYVILYRTGFPLVGYIFHIL